MTGKGTIGGSLGALATGIQSEWVTCFFSHKILALTEPQHYYPQNAKFYYYFCPMLGIKRVKIKVAT